MPRAGSIIFFIFVFHGKRDVQVSCIYCLALIYVGLTVFMFKGRLYAHKVGVLYLVHASCKKLLKRVQIRMCMSV